MVERDRKQTRFSPVISRRGVFGKSKVKSSEDVQKAGSMIILHLSLCSSITAFSVQKHHLYSQLADMSSRTAVPTLRRTLASGQIRGFRSSSSTLAAPGGRGAARATDDARRPDGWDIKNVQPFQFDDTTTIGHMILERQREKVGTLMKIEQDRALLQGELPGAVCPILQL